MWEATEFINMDSRGAGGNPLPTPPMIDADIQNKNPGPRSAWGYHNN